MAKEKITYKENITGQDLSKYIKAIAFPLIGFSMSLYTINEFGAFGSGLISPLTAVMWVTGLIVALVLPSHRKGTLNETIVAVTGYSIGLMGLRLAIQLTSGVSTEMLVASYGEMMNLTGGSSASGFLQNMLWIVSVMTPIGFIGMQGKKLFQFRRTVAKNKMFDRLRSIRENTNR